MTEKQPSLIELPDFDTLADLLVEEGAFTLSPSELHGLLSGQVAAGARFDPDSLFSRLVELLDLQPFRQDSTRTHIMRLYLATLQQLEAPDFCFELVLPDDDQPLAVRADALGIWCSGFLSGFGLQELKGGQALSVEGQETLRDLAQIVQISTEADAEAEEDENDLMEVQEYVRMAVLLVFSECNEPDELPREGAAAEPPVLH